MRGYLVVEGHGEVGAALNLVARLWADLRLPAMSWADPPIRGGALHTEAGLRKVANLVRPRLDASALLVVRDEDDACPRETGPRASRWLAEERLPFPAAVVLLRREFETLFLPCLHRMAGKPIVSQLGIERPGLRPEARFTGDAEGPRDAKGAVSSFFASGRYKPTLDQLALTRLIEFQDLRAAGLPAFGTLERALRFLGGQPPAGAVYPPVA